MLHRDISPNNLMLVRPSPAKQAGLLIDFDYGALLDDARTISPGFRTVRLINLLYISL
jgi:serine/threonine protein kinase